MNDMKEALDRVWGKQEDRQIEMSAWRAGYTLYSSVALRYGINFVEQQCTKCKRWSVRGEDDLEYEYCPRCGSYMVKEV